MSSSFRECEWNICLALELNKSYKSFQHGTKDKMVWKFNKYNHQNIIIINNLHTSKMY